MEISSLKVMKAYRKNGRLIYIFKLALPLIMKDGVEDECEFNIFYRDAAKEYLVLAERVTEECSDQVVRARTLSVDYEIETVSDTISVRRKVSNITECGQLEYVETDYYDLKYSVFVKTPKNMRKQRFIPSRNSKKHKKTD